MCLIVIFEIIPSAMIFPPLTTFTFCPTSKGFAKAMLKPEITFPSACWAAKVAIAIIKVPDCRTVLLTSFVKSKTERQEYNGFLHDAQNLMLNDTEGTMPKRLYCLAFVRFPLFESSKLIRYGL